MAVTGSGLNLAGAPLPSPSALLAPQSGVPAFNATPKPLAAPNNDTFTLSSAATPGAFPAQQAAPIFSPPMASFPSGASAGFMPYGGPQIMYVPVLAPSSQPGAAQNPMTDNMGGQAPINHSSRAPEIVSEDPEFPARLPGEPPTAKEVGQKVGKAVEHILNSNPELLDDADRLNLDDPDALVKQLHGAVHPFVSWVPNPVMHKIVGQLPPGEQETAKRVLDWLDTPTANLQSLTTPGTPPPVSHNTPRRMTEHSKPKTPSDSLDSLQEEPVHSKKSSSAESDPFADLFPAEDSPASGSGKMAGLKEKLNPLKHLPGRKKEESLDEFTF